VGAGRDVIFTILAIDRASHTMDKIAARTEAAGAKFGTFGKLAGAGLGLIAVAAAEAGTKAVEMAAHFESTMAQLHTQAGVGQKAVDDLKGHVLDLAGKVGTDPDSLGEALYHIESSFASTGIKGSEAMHILETAAKGAKIGHADLVDVTNALDAAIASGIPGVKNFDQAMGSLNATVGAGDMHMQDLADAFSTGMLATVKGYGLSLRDVSAALATFGDNNIRGQLAGNQLRMSVQALAVPMSHSSNILKELGLNTDTLAKAMQHGGLREGLQVLVDHLHKAGVTGKETGQVLTEAFGRKAGTGLNILVDQFSRVKSKYEEVDKGANKFASTWQAQTQLLAQKWDQMRAGADAFMIRLGTALIPVLLTAMDDAGKFGHALATAFSYVANNPWLMTLVTALTAGAAAWALVTAATATWTAVTSGASTVMGLYTLLIEKATVQQGLAAMEGMTLSRVQGIMAVAQMELNAAFLANPIGITVIALAALAAGLYYAFNHFQPFHDAVMKVWGALQAAFTWITQNWKLVLGILLAPILAVPLLVATHWSQVVTFFQGLGPKIAAAWNGTLAFFASLPGLLVDGLKALPGLLWSFIKFVLEKTFYLIGFSIGLWIDLFIKLPAKVGQALAGLPGIVWHWMTTSGAQGLSALGSWIANAVKAVAGFLVKVGQVLADLPNIVFRWLTTTGVQGFKAWVNFHVQLAAKAQELVTTMGQKAAEIVVAVVKWLATLPGRAVEAIHALPGLIKGALADAGSWLLDAGRQIVQGLVNGIKNAAGAAVSAVKDLGGNLLSGFKDAMGIFSPSRKMMALGRDVIAGVTEGLKQEAPNTYAQLRSFALKIADIRVSSAVRAHVKTVVDQIGASMVLTTNHITQLRDKIDAQRQAVADLIKKRNEYAAQLADGLKFNVGGYQVETQATAADGTTRALTSAEQAAAFVQSMQDRSASIKAFNDNLNKLRSEGLSQSMLQQLASAGVETGGALAAALSSATPAALSQINALDKQINTRSDAFGKTWAGQMYDAGIQAGQGVTKGLESQVDKLLAQVRRMAQRVVDELKRELRIKSPSQRMHDEVGAMIPAGIAAGMDANAHLVASAAARIVPTSPAAYGGGVTGIGRGRGGDTYHVTINARGVSTAADIARELERVIQQARGQGVKVNLATT
jgi:TP901 family phage tail tape measure protein